MKIGILGGGQLARMLALSAYPLGHNFVMLDPTEGVCAAPMTDQITTDYDNQTGLSQLADQVDVVTYEFENVPMESAAFLQEKLAVHPGPQALAAAQDRLTEKTLFTELEIPVPPIAPIDSLDDLRAAIEEIGYPAILKTRRMGYDGKGQAMIKTESDLESAFDSMQGAPAILEGFVPFSREISIIAVRSTQGEIKYYPVSENTHRDGILRLSISRANDPLQAQAEAYVTRVLEKLDYVGVIALELFQVGNSLLANEFAPRVHNSGHWTIEGAETSQFENHMRAVSGLPLGATDLIGSAAMVNFIGAIPEPDSVLAIPGAHLHDYGKSFRAGRKVGHVTLRTDDVYEFESRVSQLVELAENAEATL